MTARRIVVYVALGIVAAGLGWLLFVALPRWYTAPARIDSAPSSASAAAGDTRKIKAHLFYVSDDGLRLTAVEREVAYAEPIAAQARAIVDAQMAAVDAPLVSAVPAGTTLRALFVTPQGAAFVDLGGAIASAHPGGETAEALTVYTFVQVLTTNLPAITSVQLLVNGKDVDTLAGHVDTKRPIARTDAWVTENVSR